MQREMDRATRTVYSTDNSIYQVLPEAVALPTSAGEISAALRANHAGERRPVVARGGGTGTNGQSLTDGTVVDLKRNLHDIVSVDPATRTAIVQPGIVTAELNRRLASHGLYWPPHTSTLNRATVGGMISTDAAGKGSLVHGRAHRHVRRLTMLLDDGTEWCAEPVSVAEAERRASAGGRSGELWRGLVEIASDARAAGSNGSLGLPELARGFSGYGIDRLADGHSIDPVALVCGAEGTLGIVTEAELALSPVPVSSTLVIAVYESFAAALADAVELRETGPSAIECFDETTLEQARNSPAWPALGATVGDHRGAVLLLEFSEFADESGSDSVIDPQQQRDRIAHLVGNASAKLEATGRSIGYSTVVDPAAQAMIWKVRADAVGLLAKMAVGGPGRSARPTAFVEDCAVPVANMGSFIADFRAVLDDAGLEYGMFGHADVGCVHVRPALDLTDPVDRRRVAEVTTAVVELVRRHGGLLWGEHGRGFRGAHVDEMLPASTIDLMRRVKTVFDPLDIFNPGKLYRPLGVDRPLPAVDEPPMRGAADGEVPVALRRDFAHAFACNGNGLCHHHGAEEAMCPSYKATGDPALSPRGRADLLRAWLRDDPDDAGRGGTDRTLEAALAENLDQCLSCSACTGHCPVEVDIPELKSRFFESYHRRHRRPVAHRALGRFEQAAVLAARVPWAARVTLPIVERLLGLVDLPIPARVPKQGSAAAPASEISERRAEIVLVPDVFTSILEPSLADAALRALRSVGYLVDVAGFVPSGKFDHVKGRRKQFAAAAERQRKQIARIAADGAIATVVEPAVALLHQHEYPNLLPDHPSEVVLPIAELLSARVERLPSPGEGAGVRLLGHCTERTTSPGTAAAWIPVLEAAGYQVDAPAIGCCGMAGIFGHEAANRTLSRRIWELSWADQIADAVAEGREPVATGYSCRSQAKRFGGHQLRHPLELLIDPALA